jgi:2-polyprenyl-3-methyl-5-hydroxy-6-metoxy-1,4-benzoquinol methylase
VVDKNAGKTAKDDVICGLCGHRTELRYPGHPGYQDPVRYDIRYCAHCDTSFAHPLEVDDKVYDLIYSNIREVPGYKRYYEYALDILNQPEPLKHLAEQEDVYWSIRNFLESYRIGKESAILEVGCGFGYLTYSIASAGYNITGLDISQEAIQNATARYGNHYVCADLYRYVQDHKKQYDVVVLTELIEHIPDVLGFLTAIDSLVKDDGYIVLTTRNKTAYREEILWETELPPIHLWWFSRTSVALMARSLGREAVFTDFTEYNKLNPFRQYPIPAGVPTKEAIFTADGRLVSSLPRQRSLAKSLKKLTRKLVSKVAPGNPAQIDRDTLCAVLVRKGKEGRG